GATAPHAAPFPVRAAAWCTPAAARVAPRSVCPRVEPHGATVRLPHRSTDFRVASAVPREADEAGARDGSLFLRHPRRPLERRPAPRESPAGNADAHSRSPRAARCPAGARLREKGRVFGRLSGAPLDGLPG